MFRIQLHDMNCPCQKVLINCSFSSIQLWGFVIQKFCLKVMPCFKCFCCCRANFVQELKQLLIRERNFCSVFSKSSSKVTVTFLACHLLLVGIISSFLPNKTPFCSRSFSSLRFFTPYPFLCLNKSVWKNKFSERSCCVLFHDFIFSLAQLFCYFTYFIQYKSLVDLREEIYQQSNVTTNLFLQQLIPFPFICCFIT